MFFTTELKIYKEIEKYRSIQISINFYVNLNLFITYHWKSKYSGPFNYERKKNRLPVATIQKPKFGLIIELNNFLLFHKKNPPYFMT